MTLLAIPPISGEGDAIEIVHRASVPVDGVVSRQLGAGVDLVDHRSEVDRLRRVLPSRSYRGISAVRVVTKHAHLNLIAVPAMHRKTAVAIVAILEGDYRAARLCRTAIHRE